jgi:hypothetical protein
MIDSNNGNDSGNKGNNADGNKGKGNDPVGKLSDGLLRLVEEDDGKGNVSYSVETVNGDELVYSSISKAQAFSFCEGYRTANGLSRVRLKKMTIARLTTSQTRLRLLTLQRYSASVR